MNSTNGIFICMSSYALTAFVASILVWAERERLHLDESADRVILYIHVSVDAWKPYTSFFSDTITILVQGIYMKPKGLRLWCPKHSEGATKGLRVSESIDPIGSMLTNMHYSGTPL